MTATTSWPEKIRLVAAALKRRPRNVADYPNPDMAVEIDISPPEVDREGIYKRLQVAEIWYFDGEDVTIEQLGEDGTYAVATPRVGFCRSRPSRSDDGRGRRFERPDRLVPPPTGVAAADLPDTQARHAGARGDEKPTTDVTRSEDILTDLGRDGTIASSGSAVNQYPGAASCKRLPDHRAKELADALLPLAGTAR